MKALVTKLNGTVTDGNLLRLGELRVTFKPSKEDDSLIVLSNYANTKAIFSKQVKTEDGIIQPNVLTQLTKEIKAASTNTVEVSLLKKYDFPSFLGLSYGELDLDMLEYSKDITSIMLQNCNPTGSLSVFSKLPKLTTISNLAGEGVTGDLSDLLGVQNLSKMVISCPNITGDIAVLKQMKNLKTFNLYNSGVSGDIKELAYLDITDFTTSITLTKVSGNIEDYVKVKRQQGTTTGSASFNWIGNGLIKFNGTAIKNVQSNTLSWTNSTITFNDETINL